MMRKRSRSCRACACLCRPPEQLLGGAEKEQRAEAISHAHRWDGRRRGKASLQLDATSDQRRATRQQRAAPPTMAMAMARGPVDRIARGRSDKLTLPSAAASSDQRTAAETATMRRGGEVEGGRDGGGEAARCPAAPQPCSAIPHTSSAAAERPRRGGGGDPKAGRAADGEGRGEVVWSCGCAMAVCAGAVEWEEGRGPADTHQSLARSAHLRGHSHTVCPSQSATATSPLLLEAIE